MFIGFNVATLTIDCDLYATSVNNFIFNPLWFQTPNRSEWSEQQKTYN